MQRTLRGIGLLAAIPAGLYGQQNIYHGRTAAHAVQPPRLEASVSIDGSLDEPAWQAAALLTGFSQYQPVDGRPAEDSTEVLVWYTHDAIYFGIRAHERHADVRATLADRDKIDTDDYVQILLDTFNDRRRAYVFGVNPLGVQADGIRTEGGFGGAGGRSREMDGRFENVDMNPDFTFASRGRVTATGYEVELRIPFKSLSFGGADPLTWSINVIRKIQHSAYQDTWTPAVRASASFLSQSGTLEGLSGLRRGLVLSANPFTTGRLDGAPDSLGNWAYDATPEVGLNLSWGITSNLTLDGTANPDFSQVEADVAQVTVNERFALFFPEKRPFFLEGIELFNTPNSLIYTRRIVDPVAGLKLTGKVAGTSVALLSAVDDKRVSATGDDYPVVNALRVRRDLGDQSTVGLAYTDRVENGAFNRVIGADARIVFGRLYYFEVQGANSWTGGDSTVAAPLWEATVDRTGRSFGFHYQVQGIAPDFRTDAGYVPRTGFVQPSAANRFSFYGRPGALIEQWTNFVRFEGLWNYDEFFDGGSILESSASVTSFFTIRNGWGARITPGWSTVRFDPPFYAEYSVDGGADTTALVLPGRLTDLWNLSVSGSTPQGALTASLGGSVGRSAAFFEPAAARSLSANATVTWRPTEQIRLEGRYVYSRLNRPRDGTRLSTAHIPRLKMEYQLSRAVFVRFVGQYTAQERDALRDPATDRPILLPSDDGTLEPVAARALNDLRMDFLFSYHPTPGTVFYLGYGSSLTEEDAFTFRDVSRVSDGFFVKLSYLFRL